MASAGNKYDTQPVSSLLEWDHYEAGQSLKPKCELGHEMESFWNLAIAHLLCGFMRNERLMNVSSSASSGLNVIYSNNQTVHYIQKENTSVGFVIFNWG